MFHQGRRLHPGNARAIRWSTCQRLFWPVSWCPAKIQQRQAEDQARMTYVPSFRILVWKGPTRAKRINKNDTRLTLRSSRDRCGNDSVDFSVATRGLACTTLISQGWLWLDLSGTFEIRGLYYVGRFCLAQNFVCFGYICSALARLLSNQLIELCSALPYFNLPVVILATALSGIIDCTSWASNSEGWVLGSVRISISHNSCWRRDKKRLWEFWKFFEFQHHASLSRHGSYLAIYIDSDIRRNLGAENSWCKFLWHISLVYISKIHLIGSALLIADNACKPNHPRKSTPIPERVLHKEHMYVSRAETWTRSVPKSLAFYQQLLTSLCWLWTWFHNANVARCDHGLGWSGGVVFSMSNQKSY